jgi:hypothetical protein
MVILPQAREFQTSAYDGATYATYLKKLGKQLNASLMSISNAHAFTPVSHTHLRKLYEEDWGQAIYYQWAFCTIGEMFNYIAGKGYIDLVPAVTAGHTLYQYHPTAATAHLLT